MNETAGIFYQGLTPSQIAGVDAWKDKKWDEVADKVGKHFEEPRVRAHWTSFANFMERLHLGIRFDEQCRSTTA
jgi:hypothetical protein